MIKLGTAAASPKMQFLLHLLKTFLQSFVFTLFDEIYVFHEPDPQILYGVWNWTSQNIFFFY